jgi:hypothetical protein
MTRYYWYPGERSDWVRAALAAGCGILAAGLIVMTTHSTLWATVVGTSVTAGVAGLTFGRKDVQALQTFARFAPLDTGRAVWRATVKGFGAAAAAVLVVHAARNGGFVASWILPLVPAVVGAVAHQGGMLQERVSAANAERDAQRQADLAAGLAAARGSGRVRASGDAVVPTVPADATVSISDGGGTAAPSVPRPPATVTLRRADA